MKHISHIILFLSLSIQVVFAFPENSVEDANDYLIITTYNETGKTRPMVWTLRKKIIQSVDFADTEPVRSSKDHNKVIRFIVRIRITTTELQETKQGIKNKQYISLWIDIDKARKLMKDIAIKSSKIKPIIMQNKSEQTDRLPLPSQE